MSIRSCKFLIIIALVITSAIPTAVSGQGFSCGMSVYESIQEVEDVNVFDSLKRLEKNYRGAILQSDPKRNFEYVTLPVVFQVIHNNGTENISDNLLLQQLEHLNHAFGNAELFYSEDGVDTKVQFCLAQQDEEGNAFNGIERYVSPFTDMSQIGSFEFVKNLKLDPNRYINIQVVKEVCLGSNCSLSGFAGNGRVVLDSYTFGSDPLFAAALVHELGHFLGLKHTFNGGCKNSNCLIDGDRVCDTPPDNVEFEGCWDDINSCTTDEDDTSSNNPFRPIALGGLGDQQDLNTNYMDYNHWNCYELFTEGQAERMHFFISEVYHSLTESRVCLPPCPNDVFANFTTPDSIEVGEEVTFENLSINENEIRWYINGVLLSQDESFSYQFDELGVFNLALVALSQDTLCFQDSLVQPIVVYCPVEVCFDYSFTTDYFIFEDCSINEISQEWTIITNNEDTIYQSNLDIDSLLIDSIEFIKICLQAYNDYCTDMSCKFINFVIDGSEICNNGEDDDEDGLIDLFDPDCPCEESAYQAQCQDECIDTTSYLPEFSMKLKWQSDIIGNSTSNIVCGDLDGNGMVSIVTTKSVSIDLFNQEVHIVIIDGNTGQFKIDSTLQENIRGFVAIGDVNNDSQSEILYSHSNYVSVFTKDLNLLFNTDLANCSCYGPIHLADINADGFPEIIKSTSVFNGSTGRLLVEGNDNMGCNLGASDCGISVTAVSDLSLSSGLEIAAGGQVYEFEIANLDNSIGNSSTIVQGDSSIDDGFTSIADINKDGTLDIIVVRDTVTFGSINGGIWVWDLTSGKIIAESEALSSASLPVIGDLDGDCIPEIIVTSRNEMRAFSYDGSTDLKVSWQIPISETGKSPPILFDFNKDSRLEIVYRDLENLYVIDGVSGGIIINQPIKSVTSIESPIIADVDGDGQAEILVSGYTTTEEEARVYCFESDGIPWASARSVWNQYAYNPTFVNDDLSIPRYPQNPAIPLIGTENCPLETCPTPYNNYMVQATYRTQEGCYVWPEQDNDLSIAASSSCNEDSMEICLYTSTSDTSVWLDGINATCYLPPWNTGAQVMILDEILVLEDTACFNIPMLEGVDSIMIVVNDEGGIYPPAFPNTDYEECDYSNNEFVLQLKKPDLAISILDYECTSDSLFFTIEIQNLGSAIWDSCFSLGYYFIDPIMSQNEGNINPPIEILTLCIDSVDNQFNNLGIAPFQVAIVIPTGESDIFWTINDVGSGPGQLSSESTNIYECNYDNNVSQIVLDIEEKTLDLGPDIVKCETEIITLSASSGFSSYLWNDLSTDSIYSSGFGGVHYVEVTDNCNRKLYDTITFTIEEVYDLDLGPDLQACFDEIVSITLDSDYDRVNWYPINLVDCDTCSSIVVEEDTLVTIIGVAQNDFCISSDTIRIERIYPFVDTIISNQCKGDSLEFHDQTIFQSGIYSHLSPDCTELDVLDVTFFSNDTSLMSNTICLGDSLFFNGNFYKNPGVYDYVTLNSKGCDSLILLDLKVEENIEVYDTLLLCEGDSALVFSQIVYDEIALSESYTSVGGCDSTQTIFVQVQPLGEEFISRTICQRDSIILFNEWYYEAGIYEVRQSISNDCDSLYMIEIIEKKISTSYDTLRICQGDTINVFGFNVFEENELIESYEGSNGCDSISHMRVEVIQNLSETEELYMCQGDSIKVGDIWIKDPDTLLQYFNSSLGCDSVYTTIVSIIENPELPQVEIDCEVPEVIATINVGQDWKVLWSNGDSSSQTSFSPLQSNISVLLSSSSGCEVEHIQEMPILPNYNEIIILNDTTVVEEEGFQIDLGLNEAEWNVLWSSTSIIGCDTCMIANFSTLTNSEVNVLFSHISGCEIESTFKIRIESQDKIINIPNIFSPNGDSNNDVFEVTIGQGSAILQCQIYDRWGNIVYSSKNDELILWDGQANGKPVLQGIYVYVIAYRDSNGNRLYKIGDVAVIR